MPCPGPCLPRHGSRPWREVTHLTGLSCDVAHNSTVCAVTGAGPGPCYAGTAGGRCPHAIRPGGAMATQLVDALIWAALFGPGPLVLATIWLRRRRALTAGIAALYAFALTW